MWSGVSLGANPLRSTLPLPVVVSLQGMCVQVLNFDTTLVLHAWRTLVKEVGRCRAALGEEEAVNDVLGLSGLVQDLCTATAATYGKCLELASSEGGQQFQRHLKSCKHLLSLLLVLLRVSSREGRLGRGGCLRHGSHCRISTMAQGILCLTTKSF